MEVFDVSQIIKDYPPEVQACRERLFSIMDAIKAEELALLQRVPEYDRLREEQRIQHRYQTRCAPYAAELSRLEMFAKISFVVKERQRGGGGEMKVEKPGPSLGSKEAEWKRLAIWHAETADQYAERSHEVEQGEISDGYSAASEAHNQLSRAFAKKAGIDLGRDK